MNTEMNNQDEKKDHEVIEDSKGMPATVIDMEDIKENSLKGSEATNVRETDEASSTSKQSEQKERKGKVWPQVVASTAANMGAFAFGAVLAWSATGLPSIQESQELGTLTDSDESWIGSIATLGAVAACPFAGFGLGSLGRRKVMLYLTIPFICGWLLIALADRVAMIYAGRFITGFCGGAFSIAAPVFTAETANPSVRGMLGSFFDLLMSLGMFYIYVVGKYVEWRYQAVACAIIPVAFHIIMYFVPESPFYLVEQDKHGKAEKAIKWLRRAHKTPNLVQSEMQQISKSVEDLRRRKSSIASTMEPSIFKPTLLMIGLMTFCTLSGFDVVIAYTVFIFNSAGASIDPQLCTIIIGVVVVVATIPAALMVDSAGRRMLLMLSGLGCCVSHMALGLYFYLKSTHSLLFGYISYSSLSWLPLVALVSFVIAFSIGFGPLSMLMMGEILPNHMKGFTSCVVLMTRWGLAFAVIILYSSLKYYIHDYGTYWLYSAVCFLSIIFVYILVPETNGKTLDEIQEFFEPKPKSLLPADMLAKYAAQYPSAPSTPELEPDYRKRRSVVLVVPDDDERHCTVPQRS